LQDQSKEVNESRDKYTRELEANRELTEQVKLIASKLDEHAERVALLSSQLEEKTLSNDVLQTRLSRQAVLLD
jgi:hypothetical protein